jgi:tetratricopeptide (TPR) repeat protein
VSAALLFILIAHKRAFIISISRAFVYLLILVFTLTICSWVCIVSDPDGCSGSFFGIHTSHTWNTSLMLRSLPVSRLFRPSTRRISSIVVRAAAVSLRISPLSYPALQFRPFASKKKSSAKSAAAAADASLALQREAQSHFDEALQAEFSGRLADAEAAALQSLTLRRRAFNESDNHDHVIESLTVLGHIYLAAQQADTAVPYLERAVVAALVVHGEQNADNQIPSLTALALALQLCASPDLPRAEELLTRASGITDRRFAKHGDKLPDHPQRARRLSEMAVLRRAQGRHDEALSLFRQSLDMRRRCYGDDAEYFAGIARDHTMFGDQQTAGDVPHPDLCQSYGHIGMHLFAHAQQLANQIDPAAAARAAQARQDKTDADEDSSPLGEAVTALYRAVHLQHVHARVHQLRPNFAVHEALAAALTRMVLYCSR